MRHRSFAGRVMALAMAVLLTGAFVVPPTATAAPTSTPTAAMATGLSANAPALEAEMAPDGGCWACLACAIGAGIVGASCGISCVLSLPPGALQALIGVCAGACIDCITPD